MMIKKERHHKESVVVVLDGFRVSTEKNGVEPLRCALCDLVVPGDEVLVITILSINPMTPLPSPDASFCCLGERKSNHAAGVMNYLNEGIDRKIEAYTNILAPYYDKCRSSGVKFEVKIAIDFKQDILVKEANNVKANWIVMDRLFTMDQSFLLSGTNCNISLVRNDEDTVFYRYSPAGLEISVVERMSLQHETHPHDTLRSLKGENQEVPSSNIASTSRGRGILATSESLDERENSEHMELPTEGTVLLDNVASREVSKANLMPIMPLELSWEVISEITCGFSSMVCEDQTENCRTYRGRSTSCLSYVFVKRFSGDFSGILVTEKRAALALHHKNIIGLIGYHKSENETILVFPQPARGTLNRYLTDSRGSWRDVLTFQDKMKIAIGIAKGVRYMHEECPRGPIVHGDLQPCNIYLKRDFKPQITGFGQAKWLQLRHTSPISSDRGSHEDHLDAESLALVKSDIHSFGILLLRLFCRRSAPKDQQKLIEWARPLLLQRAYHELLDEDNEYEDMHGILRVVCAATQCTKTKPLSRPSMSEVISILKGESSCAMASSPSSESSPIVLLVEKCLINRLEDTSFSTIAM